MGRKGKAATLILVFLVFISLGAAGGAYYFLTQERQAKVALQQQLEEAKLRENDTRRRLEESKKNAAELDSKLKEAKAQVETLTKDVETQKQAKQEAYGQIDKLMAQLDQEKKAKKDLDKMLAQTYDDMGKISSQLKDLDVKKKDLEAKIKDLETKAQKVELGKIVVSPEQQAAAQAAAAAGGKPVNTAGLEGKVLVVNKDYNFVVTNLGKKDGIDVGDTFSVYHGDSYVGDVKIEKIHDSMSAAGFVSAETKDKVNEGDKVVHK